MATKCSYVWPSNHRTCEGEVVPCPEFPRRDESGRMTWFRLYGRDNLKKAQANPDKSICLNCGTLYDTLPALA